MQDEVDIKREQQVDTSQEVDTNMFPTEAILCPFSLVGPQLVFVLLRMRPLEHLMHLSH